MATASPRRKRGHDRGTGHDESDAEDADAWEYENGAGSSSSFQRAGSLPDVRLDATIKLFVTHTEPHYSLPWQMRRQTSSTSTGFVIEGKRILTNAHCVDNFAVVKVKKRASSTKYVAEVIAIGRECVDGVGTLHPAVEEHARLSRRPPVARLRHDIWSATVGMDYRVIGKCTIRQRQIVLRARVSSP